MRGWRGCQLHHRPFLRDLKCERVSGLQKHDSVLTWAKNREYSLKDWSVYHFFLIHCLFLENIEYP